MLLDKLISGRLNALFVLHRHYGEGGSDITATCIGDLVQYVVKIGLFDRPDTASDSDLTTLVVQLRLLETVLQSGAQADPLSTEAMLAHSEPWWSSKTEELLVSHIAIYSASTNYLHFQLQIRLSSASRVLFLMRRRSWQRKATVPEE